MMTLLLTAGLFVILQLSKGPRGGAVGSTYHVEEGMDQVDGGSMFKRTTKLRHKKQRSKSDLPELSNLIKSLGDVEGGNGDQSLHGDSLYLFSGSTKPGNSLLHNILLH